MESEKIQPTVWAFESCYDKYNVLLSVGGKPREVQFEGHEFVTDVEPLAKALMASSEFHKEESGGGYWLLEGIEGANKKKRDQRYKVHSGSVGT